MQITLLNIKDIKPYEKNPRKNEQAIDFIANSIKEFGFKVPITVDEDFVIITGHTRYEACKKLEIDKIPCIIVKDLSKEQIKAFRLADNKVSEKADWDFNKLEEELKNIKNIHMELYGFIKNEEEFNWDDIKEIDEDNYEEPEHKMCECPYCHHIDRNIHFRKV